jgi:hypothetical protein
MADNACKRLGGGVQRRESPALAELWFPATISRGEDTYA